jgi:hypothetical protein
MPSEHAVAALTAALTDIEHHAEQGGWGANPAVFGLFDEPYRGDIRVIVVDELPVEESVWRLHDQIEPKIPYWVALRSIADRLTCAEAPEWLPDWLRRGQRGFIGFAFLCEGLDTAALLHDLTATATQVRALIGCDVDGRYYEVLRPRGATHSTVRVLPDPDAATRAAAIADCLYRLVAALRPQPGGPQTVRVTLPTTGYVVLETSQRDGEQPQECTTFIDSAGRMDDAAAIAYLTEEITSLAQHAPADVVHTMRLVHRTHPDGTGDRELLAPDPVRGAGTPLTD